MISNFYSANSNRMYPFVWKDPSTITQPLDNGAILDCKFYIDNPVVTSFKVYLDSKTANSYTFKNTIPGSSDLVFTIPNQVSDWSSVWSYNDDWYGMIVVGRSQE